MDEPVVRTTSGALRGRRVEHGVVFGGIPYAAPPVGERRFRRPAPPEPWDGTRDATALSPPLPQPARQLPGLDTRPLLGRWEGQEPALELNVWTPDPAADGLPVLVFLHGGAFVAGAAGLPLYGGGPWMRDGVVLVTVGYRLGIEGFVAFQGGDTNVALHDQLAALRWVQDEIAGFGGDPARVTLAGQSAGAMSTGWLLGTERSRGLFARAISMSGGLDVCFSPAQGAAVAAFVAGRLGVEPTADAMRGVPIADVMALQGSVTPDQVDLTVDGERNPTGGLIWITAVRDGDVVAEDPLTAVGAGAQVDLLAGDTVDEGAFFLAGLPGFEALPEAVARGFVAGLTDDVDATLSAYREELGTGATPGAVMALAITDHAFRAPTARLLERHAQLGHGATFAYRFGWRSEALGGRLGAAHAVDLPFAWDMLGADGLTGADDALLGTAGGPQALADTMHAAWVRFVRDGDPGWAPHPHVESLT